MILCIVSIKHSRHVEKQNIDLQIAIETQKTGWYVASDFHSSEDGYDGPGTTDLANRKLNTPPSKIEDKEMLSKLLVNPPIKKIDLAFPLGLTVTARNMKGVTIKDALEAIYKQFKKKVSFPHQIVITHMYLPSAQSSGLASRDPP